LLVIYPVIGYEILKPIVFVIQYFNIYNNTEIQVPYPTLHKAIQGVIR